MKPLRIFSMEQTIARLPDRCYLGFMAKLAILMALVLFPIQAFGWAEHHLVTRAALTHVYGVLPGQRPVTVTPITELLDDLDFESPSAFNQSIQIRKEYRFLPKLAELPGSKVDAIDVLAVYSDEPDWGMDIELFDEDQYPELWRDEYSMMGGKEGTPSQAHRHMHWPVSLKHPIQSFHLPPSHLFKAMGIAHERMKLFVDISRKAAAAGHEYWSLRFLGNALHYLQDVASLFHSTQTPTKHFMMMPFTNRKLGSGFTDYVKQVLNIISYYHFAFEDYIGWVMRQGQDSEEGDYLAGVLAESKEEYPDLTYSGEDPGEIVRALALRSLALSAEAGRASLDFFPEITVPYAGMDAHAELDEAWWKEVIELGRKDSRAKRTYFSLVSEIFAPLGHAVRQAVKAELDLNGSTL